MHLFSTLKTCHNKPERLWHHWPHHCVCCLQGSVIILAKEPISQCYLTLHTHPPTSSRAKACMIGQGSTDILSNVIFWPEWEINPTHWYITTLPSVMSQPHTHSTMLPLFKWPLTTEASVWSEIFASTPEGPCEYFFLLPRAISWDWNLALHTEFSFYCEIYYFCTEI